MPKSIRTGVEVFQYAIRFKPTGKYLKKTPGSSFYETDIPAVYNSPKVALRSLENESKWGRYKVADCEIVKFRLIMEEVKEPPLVKPKNCELTELKLLKTKFLYSLHGDFQMVEISDEHLRNQVFAAIESAKASEISKSYSTHCYSQTYKIDGIGEVELTYEFNGVSYPISITLKTPTNLKQKIEDLEKELGIK